MLVDYKDRSIYLYGGAVPKISQVRRDSRRQQILDAALACFSEDGFHQTGMATIVERSGLSHGAVYGYFAAKEDIIVALADDRQQREAILNAVAREIEDPIEGLHRLVRAYAQWLKDPTGVQGRRVGVHGWAEALRNQRVHARIVEGIDIPRTLITDLVERARTMGRLPRELSADAIARSLVAIYQGFVLQAAWGEGIDIDACAAVVQHMLRGLSGDQTREAPETE
jgi:AcrR family transcriptional regulator